MEHLVTGLTESAELVHPFGVYQFNAMFQSHFETAALLAQTHLS
jgi:hypothetical protein